MIISYHPCYEADANLLCAGRQPDDDDRAALQAADAVILPQGCSAPLYWMARAACPHVFPNYDARFRYPGKTGQANLFQAYRAPHPQTWIFESTMTFEREGKEALAAGFPLVLKLDWGGEGDAVYLLNDRAALNDALIKVRAHERTGQKGFVLQAYISGSHRTLRVVVAGGFQKAYWRVQDNPSRFAASVAKGARIDQATEPHLQKRGITLVRAFGERTGINLAGFDLLFDETNADKQGPVPLLLEINYFFGRAGLGGSEAFYAVLREQVDRWLEGLGLQPPKTQRQTP